MNNIQTEFEHLNLAEAEAFFAVTIHRDPVRGVTPTVTVVGMDELDRELGKEMQAHLDAIARTLRKAYAAH